MIKFNIISTLSLCLPSTISTTSSIQTKIEFKNIETTESKNTKNFNSPSKPKSPTMDTTIEKLNAWYYSLPSNKVNDYKKEISNFYNINKINSFDSTPKYNVSLNNDLVSKYYNQHIINNDIYNLLVSKNYITTINSEVNDDKLDSINIKNNKLNFNGDDDSNVMANKNLDNNTSDIWVISHWYWFGYWKLCFNEDISKILEKMFDDGDNAATISYYIAELKDFKSVPILGQILNILSDFLYGFETIFDSDEGAGIYIGFWILVPCYIGALSDGNQKANGSFDDYCYGWGYQKETNHEIIIADYSDYFSWDDYVKKVGAFIMEDFVCECGIGNHDGSGNDLTHTVKWTKNNYSDVTYFDKLTFNYKPIRVITYDHNSGLCKQHAELNVQLVNDEQHQKIILKTNSYENGTDSWKSIHTKLDFSKIGYFKRNE